MQKIKKTFYDENKKRNVSYVLSSSLLGNSIASDLMDGFAEITGHYNSRSRDQAWRSVMKFVRYICSIGIDDSSVGLDVVSGFAEYLKKSERLRKTNGSHYNFIRRLIRSISEASANPIWFDQGLKYESFIREKKCDRDNQISTGQLRRIATACKKEIIAIKEKFSLREFVQRNDLSMHPSYTERELTDLKQLILNEQRGLWTQKELLIDGQSVLASSGLRRHSSYKELTIEATLPIFLLIMIQTAANPFSLMEINRDCILDNPLDPNSVTLEWAKHRASKAQKISLIRAGNFSVYNLIQLIVDMTDPIRHLAGDADSDFLFITRTGRKAKRLSCQGLHDYLDRFRANHNFEHFTFTDIRRAVAELVYDRTNSVKEVKKVLQHHDERTTMLYLRGDAVVQRRYEKVAGFQGQMLMLTQKRIEENYETVLGFECSAPFTGAAGESKKGEACLEFLMCATCKNAVVPIDDPHTVARIVRAQDYLEKLEITSLLDHEDRQRFDKVYRPILDIIRNEILSNVTSKTLKAAKNLTLTIPSLPVLI